MTDQVDFTPRIGADPELFVAIASETAKRIIPVPVCGLVGGTKTKPIVVNYKDVLSGNSIDKGLGNFAYQEDNVAFEFNIPAAINAEIFSYYIQYFLSYLDEMLAKKKLTLTYGNKHRFRAEELQAHPQAMEIGCSADYVAYRPLGDSIRKPFDISELGRQRFCGGHLHLQYNYQIVPRHIMAQFMDLVIELPFLALDKQGDRRHFYGVAGLYRPKEYGIEYRTPSNFWLSPIWRHNGLVRWVAHNAITIARLANKDSKHLMYVYQRIPWIDVQKAINEEDTKLAGDVFRYCANLLMGSYQGKQYLMHHRAGVLAPFEG